MTPTAADAAEYLTKQGRHDLARAVHLALAELSHLRNLRLPDPLGPEVALPEEVQAFLATLPDEKGRPS